MKNVRRKTDGTLVSTNLIQSGIKSLSLPTKEDLEYGKHGEQVRTVYENTEAISNIAKCFANRIAKDELIAKEVADALEMKESTITNALIQPEKATVNVLMKVLNYLNIELQDAIK